MLAGFAAGRFVATPHDQGASPPSTPAANPSAETGSSASADIDSCLCQIASGNLSAARKRAARMIGEHPANRDELVSLLVAIARKDGASFDALLAGHTEEVRRDLTAHSIMLLMDDPAVFLRLLADSKEIGSMATELCPDAVAEAIKAAPDAFLEMVERGDLNWNSEMYRRFTANSWSDGAAATRIVKLLRNGGIAFDDPGTIANLMLKIADEDLEAFREGAGSPQIMKALENEIEARRLFLDFPPPLESWDQTTWLRVLNMLEKRTPESGILSFDWSKVPVDHRQELAHLMMPKLDSKEFPELLQSMTSSHLADEERNELLGQFANHLFSNGDVGQAVKFAQAITPSPDGSNIGEDLIVSWSILDPERAKTYAMQIAPSPLSERILKKVGGTSSP